MIRDKEYDICPSCGVDRAVLKGCLEDTPGSDNWEIAQKIIGNCKFCQEAIKELEQGGGSGD